VVEPGGPICGCGKRGHLEAVASGTAIANLARERLKAGEASMLTKLSSGDFEGIDAALVGGAARQGDALALSIITSAGRYVGITVASLIMLLNPEMFVLGGGVTNLGDLLFKPMHEAIREYVMTDRHWQETKFEKAQLGVDAGLVGAAALARLSFMK
jgi:glucokinase